MEINQLLPVVPGEVTAIQGNSVGGPFEIFRIPTSNTTLSVIYPDLVVMISRDSKKVIGVGAKRAFNSESECEIAEQQVREILSKAFLSKYNGLDPRWQFQTPDESITAGALCSGAMPYPVLRAAARNKYPKKE